MNFPLEVLNLPLKYIHPDPTITKKNAQYMWEEKAHKIFCVASWLLFPLFLIVTHLIQRIHKVKKKKNTRLIMFDLFFCDLKESLRRLMNGEYIFLMHFLNSYGNLACLFKMKIQVLCIYMYFLRVARSAEQKRVISLGVKLIDPQKHYLNLPVKEMYTS